MLQHLRRAVATQSCLRAAWGLGIPGTTLAATQRAALATDAPSTSSEPEHTFSRNRAHINRMLYRARQRGWLELDLLVGMWAEREVHRLSPEVLADFEVLLNQENPELYKWLTGQIEPSEEMANNTAFKSIRNEVKASMEEHGTVVSPASAEWVRGWDDYKNQLKEAGAVLGGEGGGGDPK